MSELKKYSFISMYFIRMSRGVFFGFRVAVKKYGKCYAFQIFKKKLILLVGCTRLTTVVKPTEKLTAPFIRYWLIAKRKEAAKEEVCSDLRARKLRIFTSQLENILKKYDIIP